MLQAESTGNGNWRAPEHQQPDHEIVIIGTGFAGIGVAIALKEAGIDHFVILEQASQVGGTWRDNTYPGIAVDIPSFSYQYSFELNPDWSRVFAEGDEVWRYADHCVDKYGLRDHIVFDTRVDKGEWDDDHHLWKLHVGPRVITSRFVLTATGALTQTKNPDIPGLDDFEGTMVHTGRWDHEIDLEGKRIAVIGTGATAVQLVPILADLAERLYVHQRTPIWVLPKPDLPLPRALRAAFKYLPGLQSGVRLGAAAAVEVGMVAGVVHNRQLPWIPKALEAFGRAFIRTQVADPVLREKLTPRYGFGCKRPSMSNEWHKTFTREHVDLITDPIERVTPTGIRTQGGVERDIDVLVLATGYLTTEAENVPAVPVYGRGGFDLRQHFVENRISAYEGTAFPRLPNLFAIFGPYSASGSSWMFMVESQSAHILRALKEVRRRGATSIEARQEAYDRFFEEMIRRNADSIFFNNNCETANSYYFDRHGDAPFLRPMTGIETWWRSRHYDLDDYRYAALDGTELPHDARPAEVTA